jgi:multidrug efflux pump subunit AcrB
MAALVRIALRAPYTFLVLALLILIAGPLAILRTPADIFPEIRIPVIAVVWQYAGLAPDEMAGRITTPFERSLTTTVNDIEHIEANTYTGVGIVKIYFQPGADISIANAQVTAIAQTNLRQMPPGTTPPLVLNYNASTVPIIQLALSGQGLTEQNLSDLGLNMIRVRLITVPGAAVPFPYGGKTRQIQIDADPQALHSFGLTAQDIANALAAQNLIIPAGTEKIGQFEYNILLNNAPSNVPDLGNLPIKVVNGATVYIRDVAQVRDGNPPQTNIVHVEGARSVLLSVLKNGSVSTLDIISGIRAKIEEIRASLPDSLRIAFVGDQSIFVRSAIESVIREGVIAAALTSLMILLFLGSFRSTLIIATSIPLSLLAAIALLSLLGETLNIMTLGGLALAVGILVDEATVTIENINYHLEQGKDVEQAISDGADQIATPAFVSMLCVCIVFVPMFLLKGIARYLFVPLAEAVMLAMACSFLLSRTLVPTLAKYLLHKHEPGHEVKSRNPFVLFQRAFERGFERLRQGYIGVLSAALGRRRTFIVLFLCFIGAPFALVPMLGQNFFPFVDAGQMLMHVRAPVGTRIEDTANLLGRIENAIRDLIPSEEVETIVDNIGLPVSGINTAYNNTGVLGSQDGDIQIRLRPGHQPVLDYTRMLREELPRRFPQATFSFLPADIVSQILNFGSPAPIDVQIRGPNLEANFAYASRLLSEIRKIPGAADARIQQSKSSPSFLVNVDRSRAQYVGLTERDVTNSVAVSLSGTSQVAPAFWLNPANGVQYPITIQTPQYRIDTMGALESLPITPVNASAPQVLGGVADFTRIASNTVVSQYDIQSMVEIYATPQDRDLGSLAADIQEAIDRTANEKPKAATVRLMGQANTMTKAYSGMIFGLAGAIVLIYLLIVVNFQSWLDPFIIICALPAALAGIVWMLFVTETTLSVPALTGAIMCMGVATANSVLVISFARERLEALGDATAAAIESGFVRLRPVLMTALAMVIGMTPMALGLGEGGEQNAPLGRAVIGGLIFATAATLLFVPVIFSLIHGRKKLPSQAPEGAQPAHV